MAKKKWKEFAWDKDLDFKEWNNKLLQELKKVRSKTGTNADKQLTYIIILLIQLNNGARISEAVRALKALDPANFKRKLKVKVAKRKDGEERPIVIPKEIKKEDIRRIKWYVDSVDENTLKQRTKVWFKKNYGLNTHALRYAWIAEMAERGYPAQLISKITGHANLDYILYYTQKKKAEDVLESFVFGKI